MNKAKKYYNVIAKAQYLFRVTMSTMLTQVVIILIRIGGTMDDDDAGKQRNCLKEGFLKSSIFFHHLRFTEQEKVDNEKDMQVLFKSQSQEKKEGRMKKRQKNHDCDDAVDVYTNVYGPLRHLAISTSHINLTCMHACITLSYIFSLCPFSWSIVVVYYTVEKC